jgi:hypothetical protein
MRTPDYRWQGQMKISENPCFMYGQNFKNFPKNVRIGAGMRRKNQNLFGLPIWPPKMPNLFGLANQASKTAKFVRTGQLGLKKCLICSDWPIFARLSVSTQTNYVIIHSPSISSALVPAAPDFPRPFFRAATIAFTAFRTSWSFPRSSLKSCISVSSTVSVWPSWLSLGVAVKMRRNRSDGSSA